MTIRRVLILAVLAASLGGCVDPVSVFQLITDPPKPDGPPNDRNATVDQYTSWYWCYEPNIKDRVYENGPTPCPVGTNRISYAVFKANLPNNPP